jgi:hypothetical protein
MDKAERNIKSTFNILLSIGFVVLLMLPAVQYVVPLFPAVESSENRKPADMPVFDPVNPDPFPEAFNSFFVDHFPVRNQLVLIRSHLLTNMLKVSPMPDKVIFGRDGWMYLVTRELDTYRGTKMLPESRLDSLAEELVRRRSYLSERGTKMYLFIVPTKYSVYPEYLPPYVDKTNSFTWTDQVKNALTENGIHFVDLRQTLVDSKDLGQLYLKTNNHWSNLGSFVGAQKIIETIRIDFPEIPPLNIEDYFIREQITKGGNLAYLINMVEDFKDLDYEITKKNTPDARPVEDYGYPIPEYFPYKDEFEMVFETGKDELPTLLFIRDSFGTTVIPFISEGFERSVFIFDNWNYTANEHIINQENPDIVVYLVLESLWEGFIEGIGNPNLDPI